MTEAWKEIPFAPSPGTPVCAADALTGPVSGFDLDGFPLIVLRTSAGLRAYVNACPHQFLPLDWRSNRILSEDGNILRCSNHDAGFEAITGVGIDGFGAGCALDPVPVRETHGMIVIGATGQ